MRLGVACWIALALALAACADDEPEAGLAVERSVEQRIHARAEPAREPRAREAASWPPLEPAPPPALEETPPPEARAHRVRFAPPESPVMAAEPPPSFASADPTDRERAVLEFEGDPAQLGPLLARDASPAVRRAVVQRLADEDGPAARSALRRALDDGQASVVSEAILALEAVGDEAAIPALERLRAHSDPELRALAADALDALRP